MSGVLIGRELELARIGALDELAGTAALVLVGDPGSGKSRLLAEAAERSLRLVFRVVGYEPERLVPLAAASDLLRAVAADAAFGDAAEPVRVFEAAHRALREAGPVLLVVDDVQWVDELSLALLHYVVRAAAGGRRPRTRGGPNARARGRSLAGPPRRSPTHTSSRPRARCSRTARTTARS